VPDTISTYLGRMLKAPVLVGGLLAFLWALVTRDRRLLVPASLAALGVAAYAAIGVAGLSQIERYVMLPAIGIAVLFAYAAVGWVGVPAGRLRTAWAVVGLLLLAGTAAFLPARAREVASARSGVEERSRIVDDLDSLAGRPEVRRAADRCEPVNVAGYRAKPHLANGLARPPAKVGFPRPGRPIRRGLYVGPADRSVVRDFLAADIDVRRTHLTAPPGFHPVTRNASWVLYERGCGEGVLD
jgi:hypothetical protein